MGKTCLTLGAGWNQSLFGLRHTWYDVIRMNQKEVNCHHHKHQGLDLLILSVSKVTTALSRVSSVFQLFSFPVVCSGMISKGFGFVAGSKF